MILPSNRFSFLASVVLVASAAHAESPMDCVREITMPNSYFFVASMIPATIQVHVAIGTNGNASSVDYGNANLNFRTELDRYFSRTARYAEGCAGKTIDFTVHYVVEGQKTSMHVSEVRFKPPNDIIVVCHPLEPILDPTRERRVRPNSNQK